jgi:hypothetical protein
MNWAQGAVRVLGALIAVACIAMGAARAAKEPARTLILDALDPYLPAYLANRRLHTCLANTR